MIEVTLSESGLQLLNMYPFSKIGIGLIGLIAGRFMSPERAKAVVSEYMYQRGIRQEFDVEVVGSKLHITYIVDNEYVGTNLVLEMEAC